MKNAADRRINLEFSNLFPPFFILFQRHEKDLNMITGDEKRNLKEVIKIVNKEE